MRAPSGRATIAAVLFLLSGPGILSAAEIDWMTDLDRALEEAAESERNLLVLVTAPSWCPTCRELDRGPLSEQAVAQWISRNFVPVRLEDSNPQHTRLDVPSMPSMLVLDRSGAPLAVRSGVPTAEELSRWLAEQSVVLTGRRVVIGEGLFHERSEASWELYREGEKSVLNRYDQDDRFVYLRASESSEVYYAVSRDSEAAFVWSHSEEAWQRIGSPESANGSPASADGTTNTP